VWTILEIQLRKSFFCQFNCHIES